MAKIILKDDAISSVDLVIFDKDGTLIDVHLYWSAMVGLRAALICERLGLGEPERLGLMHSMGVDVATMQLYPQGPVGIKKREVVMQAAVDYLSTSGCPDQAELCREVFAQVDEFSLERLDEIIAPIQGLYEMFEDLEAAGCKIAIATTDLSTRAWLAMAHLGLKERIDFIAGAEMVARTKPHPDMIELILQELAVAPERAVMVGDAVTDVMLGVNAGLKASIGVLSGIIREAAELRRITPYLVKSIADLKISQDD
ncbi:MAG: HAD family hydrolase [Syntrophobacterales bacterium]|jgi:HAD superfamily hydrolase (TIGR01549 family)|nr:HAD family hydrolase [Syntrophobacterales bacterium]